MSKAFYSVFSKCKNILSSLALFFPLYPEASMNFLMLVLNLDSGIN